MTRRPVSRTPIWTYLLAAVSIVACLILILLLMYLHYLTWDVSDWCAAGMAVCVMVRAVYGVCVGEGRR